MKKIKYELEIEIPQSVIDLSLIWKSKITREKLLKTYALVRMKLIREIEKKIKKKKDFHLNNLYVEIPKKYWCESINHRYRPFIDFWIDHGLMIVKTRELEYHIEQTSLFEDPRRIEVYSQGNYSKSFRVPIVEGEKLVKRKFIVTHKLTSFDLKNYTFLKSIGIESPRITKDQYGFRTYHELCSTYKKILPQKGKFIYYDFKTSIPYHLKELIKTRLEKLEIYHDPFFDLFKGDFYLNFNKELELGITDRKKIQKLFCSLLYGSKKNISPKILLKIKKRYPYLYNILGKNLGKKITRIETNFVLNKVISKLSSERILSIHDGFIIYLEDMEITDKELSNLKFQDRFVLKKNFGFC